jgi:lipoate-protein ligase A
MPVEVQLLNNWFTFVSMNTWCINQPNNDPYFNLAAEEYFLKNFREDFFILWRSRPSVVVGKHQNALAEINHEFVKMNDIPVARRLSGGGTVFHDPGNVNFTFIRNVDKISDVSFKIFTGPVIEALKKLGIEAYTTGRNDLLIEGKKISGNAEHIHKNRVLHHGTLLYDSHLEALRGALKVDLSKYEDKAVKSNRSEVGNIADYLIRPMAVEEFTDILFNEIGNNIQEAVIYTPTLTDLEAIQKLSIEKYQTWEWIFGYSPRYQFKNTFESLQGTLEISLLVEHGLLAEVSVTGAILPELSQKIVGTLKGCRHNYGAMKTALGEIEDELIFKGGLLKAMF